MPLTTKRNRINNSANILPTDKSVPINPRLISMAVAAIIPETTLDRFCLDSGIASRTVGRQVLEFLAENQIGKSDPTGSISFRAPDRLSVAMLGLASGCEVEQVSRMLAWKDFEQLASRILELSGYRTFTNLRLKRPRMEIDVIGFDPSSGLALIVDCKHWEHTNLSLISKYTIKQLYRAEMLLRRSHENEFWKGKVLKAVAVILTLRSEKLKFISGVPIVPVRQFAAFVNDIHCYLPLVNTVSAENESDVDKKSEPMKVPT